MAPLRGNLTVPCLVSDIEKIWKSEQILQSGGALTKVQSAVKLPPQHMDQGPAGLVVDLEVLGIVQRMDGKRVQMPDVFRVAFGRGRRGGVKPLK